MRTGKDRVEVASVNQPVAVGTTRVAARDIVVADANGVLAVPRNKAREVAEIARKIESAENEIRKMISQGMTLREARRLMGYHQLQTKT
jgi:regulator of RNase E activity RraA